ncbi:MAG: hypothetical protein CMB73_04110 [Euryarchaeota archaeon]|nr:hypothetical protein [Euryarchaeota archaeon]|tara:strand:- start:807 stop:1076 length:270 start_codon:yes stop_codon:yes gene_type:complete
MKLTSIFTRFGLLALLMLLLSVLADPTLWDNQSSTTLDTAMMSDSIFSAWSLPLLMLGVLLSLAMIGAAYLVRDERKENLLWELGGEEE